MFSNSSGSSETMLSLFVSLYSLISATYCSSFLYRHVKAGRDVDLIWLELFLNIFSEMVVPYLGGNGNLTLVIK